MVKTIMMRSRSEHLNASRIKHGDDEEAEKHAQVREIEIFNFVRN